mgnify:FL=1
MLKRFKKNNKGFTLVELMVVVVILGILVAIAVPVYNSVTGTAEANACKANQRTIESAIMQWYADGSNSGDPDMSALVGKYLVEEPKCRGKSYDINGTNPVTCPNDDPDHSRNSSGSTEE